MAVPKAWPASVNYLTKPRYSQSLSPTALDSVSRLVKPPEGSGDELAPLPEEGPCSLVKVSIIKDPTHPAAGEAGLFATVALKPSAPILYYLGLVHGVEDTDETSSYDLSLDRETGVGIDATKWGNEARFINDYRGIRSDGPNAEFRDCWVKCDKRQSKTTYEKRVGVYVLSAGALKGGRRAKGIRKGEEILVTYGKGFWKGRQSHSQGESQP